MRKNYFIIMVLSIMSATLVKADNKDRIVLNNGNRFSGTILGQKPSSYLIFKKDNNETFLFEFNKIKRIERELRDKDILSGLNDVIETRNGEIIKGQIIVQEFGKSIDIQTGDNVRTIAFTDISIQRKEKLNSELDLFSQAPYLDVVKCEKSKYVGVITKQDYGNDSIGSVIYVTDSLDVIHDIQVQDILQLSRIPNNKYQELKQFKIIPGQVYFNQVLGKSASVEVKNNYFFINNQFFLDGLSIYAKDNKLIIETDDTPEHRQLILARIGKIETGKATRFRKKDLKSLIQEPLSYSASDGLLKWEYKVENDNYLLLSEDFQYSFFLTINDSQ